MAKQFNDKVVVISGGSRGIGRGIAEGFAHQGAQVVLAAMSKSNLNKAVREITAAGGLKPIAVATDLRTPEGCEKVHATVKRRLKRCDILVNCAGATQAGNILANDEATWQDGFALKFFGCVRLCRLFWPMLTEAEGHVINIVGGAARTPSADFLIGGSVNAAMSNFSKGLADQGKKDGVNVNAILPGMTETDRIASLFEQHAKATGQTPEQVRDERVAKQGLKRFAQPSDMAGLTLFLCSPAASHIQGTAIAVDGGATAGFY